MNPIDYGALQVQPDLLRNFAQGLQAGSVIRDMQAQRAQQEAALAQEAAFRTEAAAHIANPTAESAASLMLKNPKLAEGIKSSWGVLNEAQQASELRDSGEFISMLQANRPDLAEGKLTQRIEALRAADKPTQKYEALLQSLQADPAATLKSAKASLAFLPGGDKVLENLGKAGTEQRATEQAPFDLQRKAADARGAESEATTKAVTAKYADSQALLDVQKKGWDIKALQADMAYKKESNRIAAMNAAASREGNDLRRQELRMKIEDAVTKRDDGVRAKVATAEASASTIDNALNTIERIKANPRLDSIVGSWEGRMPALTNDDSADGIALIDTLGSQTFLAQLPAMKGSGALSEKEGDKLQSSLQNLSRAQSEKQFRSNLDEASRLFKKARENLGKSSGAPLGKPDTPAAPGARPPLSSFQR